MHSLPVTEATALKSVIRLRIFVMCNPLDPGGFFKYHQICTLKKFYVVPTDLIYLVSSGCQIKQRSLPHAALTDWFL